MSVVNYTEVTNLIKDGDIVFVHGCRKNFIHTAIMYFTGSRFSHCFIAFRVTICGASTIMCVEAQGNTKRRVLPLSFYQKYNFTIVAAPKPWNEVKDFALRGVGIAKYNMIRAVYLGLSEFCYRRFSFKLPHIPRWNEVCSDFCGDVYGITETGSPEVLYQQLKAISNER